MPTCDYCGDEIDGEAAHLEHLRSEHGDELGPIDRRRVRAAAGEGDGLPVTQLALVGLLVAVLALVGYVVFAGGDGGGDSAAGPGPIDPAAHGHGTIEMTVLGERVDFAQDRYQLRADPFHFENGNGRVWHVHAEGVTLAWAMGTLGIDVTGDSVTYGGTTYRDGEGYVVGVTVNGEPVDPAEYVLDGVSIEAVRAGNGPHVEITVRRA